MPAALAGFLIADEDRARGALYPPVQDLRELSMHVAAAVAGRAYTAGEGLRGGPPCLGENSF